MSEPGADVAEAAPTPGALDAIGAAYSAGAKALPHTWMASVPSSVAQLVLFAGGVILLIVLLMSPLTLLAGPGGAVVILLLLLFGAVVVPMGALLLAVLHQAQLRAAWRHHQSGTPVGVADGVRGGLTDMKLNLFLAALFVAQGIGTMCFVVPGVAIEAAFARVAPAVVIDEQPVGAAAAASMRAFLRAPVAQTAVSLADFVVTWAIMGFLPVVGVFLATPLSVQLHLRAYDDER